MKKRRLSNATIVKMLRSEGGQSLIQLAVYKSAQKLGIPQSEFIELATVEGSPAAQLLQLKIMQALEEAAEMAHLNIA